jgi:hypothetical protein
VLLSSQAQRGTLKATGKVFRYAWDDSVAFPFRPYDE